MSVADRAVIASRPRVRLRIRPRVAFHICAGLLAGLAASVWVTTHLLGGYLEKDPVPLHLPLSQVSKSKLSPYQVVDATILPEEMIEALGTKEYIQWSLEDPRRDKNDPLRYPMLFVTYYTGGRTQVPHTPERCNIGAGWLPLDNGSVMKLDITGTDRTVSPVKAMVLRFSKPGQFDEQYRTVAYTFYANCTFTCDSHVLRLKLGDPRVAKAFFSKVEVSFGCSAASRSTFEPKEVQAAITELLQTVLPVLVQDHWPRPQDLLRPSAGGAATQPS
jgi:hypothetical protein